MIFTFEIKLFDEWRLVTIDDVVVLAGFLGSRETTIRNFKVFGAR